MKTIRVMDVADIRFVAFAQWKCAIVEMIGNAASNTTATVNKLSHTVEG